MKKITFHYIIPSGDFTHAGAASSDFKNKLKQMDIAPDIIRRITIAMYEGEINMVIHAEGGTIDISLDKDGIQLVLTDKGPGIEDIDRAMQEGFSTASENVISLGFGAGMGLPNMKRSADNLDIVTEKNIGTTVTMTIAFH